MFSKKWYLKTQPFYPALCTGLPQQSCWSGCMWSECDWLHLAGWLGAGHSARMTLPIFCLSACRLRAFLSLHVFSPNDLSSKVRLPYLAAHSSQEHKSQAFLMHKPIMSTLPLLPQSKPIMGTQPMLPQSKFQAHPRFRRGDCTSWKYKCNRISYSLWFKLYILPTTPLQCFANVTPWPEMLSLCFVFSPPSHPTSTFHLLICYPSWV